MSRQQPLLPISADPAPTTVPREAAEFQRCRRACPSGHATCVCATLGSEPAALERWDAAMEEMGIRGEVP